MELFHQTVSMKSVGNLTDFVRAHMLEPFDAAADVRKLIDHFEDLTAAHDAVIKARTQLEALTPIVAGCDEVDRLRAELAEATSAQQALRYAAATVTLELLATELAEHRQQARHRAHRARPRARAAIDSLRQEQQGLRDAPRRPRRREGRRPSRRPGSGIPPTGRTAQAPPRVERRPRSPPLSSRWPTPTSSRGVRGEVVSRPRGRRRRADAPRCRAHPARRRPAPAARRVRRDPRRAASASASAARASRATCSPSASGSAARPAVDEARVPFVGELVDVRPEEDRWRGAAERVLRGFALSLIVADDDYAQVAGWVDAHHLGTRLVYHRVRVGEPPPAEPTRCAARSPPSSTSSRARMPPGWPPSSAREQRTSASTSIEDLRRATRAVTVRGQVKSGNRHEKDDRRLVDDRSSYVLGWDNKAKQDALIERGTRVQEQLSAVEDAIREADRSSGALTARRDALTRAARRRRRPRRRLVGLGARPPAGRARAGSPRRGVARARRTSSARLAAIDAELEPAEQRRTRARPRHRRPRGSVSATLRAQHARSTETLAQVGRPSRPAVERAAAALRERQIDRLDAVHDVVESLRRRAHRREVTPSGRLRQVTSTHRARHGRLPARPPDRDDRARLEHRGGRRVPRVPRPGRPRRPAALRGRLQALPQPEHDPRDRRLPDSPRRSSRSRSPSASTTINTSLRDIDYNPGRFIRLDAVPTPMTEIREFRSQLRACTEGALLGGDDDELYSEDKFEQVRALIARFKGREGMTEHDRQWTPRVTDVRNWFVFNASERWRETDQEHETYADSDGKSGGQKEKLAYTILAASPRLPVPARLHPAARRGPSGSPSSTRPSGAGRTSRPASPCGSSRGSGSSCSSSRRCRRCTPSSPSCSGWASSTTRAAARPGCTT